jgi:hypothetical protein
MEAEEEANGLPHIEGDSRTIYSVGAMMRKAP